MRTNRCSPPCGVLFLTGIVLLWELEHCVIRPRRGSEPAVVLVFNESVRFWVPVSL
jgi:hypothetical protein